MLTPGSLSPDPRLGGLRERIARWHASGRTTRMAALYGEAADGQEQQLADALGQLLGLTVLRLEDLQSFEARFDTLAFAEAADRRCALVEDATGLVQLITDPFDTETLAWARSEFGVARHVLVGEDTFDAWLTQCEASMSALGSLSTEGAAPLGGQVAGDDVEVLSLRDLGAEDSPAVRFVNSTLYDALKSGASDIHLEGDPNGLAVKFRLDGVLTAMRRLERVDIATQAISRIKVMAQLDIAERRVPQDGRLQIAYGGRQIDVRVSIMPSIHGEDAVPRVLDRQHLAETLAGLTLTKLGFAPDAAAALRRLCTRPHGMFLVTGPTGSGKTTTLYAAIAETRESRDKVITIEDPVEYQLPGVLQIPVNERKGLTFARGLRSILRHDPDKILVGEIRDAETAQIAVQSALTGHLVFTTVHANSVFDVVGRFEQFGIDAYTFASAINGVLAQRLLRRVCSHCATPDELPKAWVSDGSLQWALDQHAGIPHSMRAKGCERCRGTGYAGRFALGELLNLTPPLQDLLAARAPQSEVRAQAQHNGWRSLRDQAMQALLNGLTTAEEVDRVAA
jgi:general secretion pathway protein E